MLSATWLTVVVAALLLTAHGQENGRLPASLRPYHYDLEIQPHIYAGPPPFPFDGHVVIYFNCTVATSVVTVNSDGLTIRSLSVAVAADSPVQPPRPPVISSTRTDLVWLMIHVNLTEALTAGVHYTLTVTYYGNMRTNGQGLYSDSYVTAGVTRYIAATQLESIYAKTMFPSFDEPALKATFNTTVLRMSNVVSLSNMPRVSQEDRPGGWVADIYARSPVMSTYQVCIVIGDYQSVSSETINGYEVRIWSRPEMLAQMNFAASVASKVQAWLDAETGHPYPLPKMDHIALPSKGGAMENWGLITYGEESIAINPETSPATSILNVASIVAHELAHQWYGNLVTCLWWDDIWLQEGFATHYNYYPNEAIGWLGSETQQIDTRRGVQMFLDRDNKNNSDPIRKVINTPAQAPDAFSGSTYPKGGAVIRMMKAILTPTTFNRALTRYLDTYQYSTATHDQFMAVMSQQAAIDGITNPDGSALDMKSRMDAWFNQMGYPLLTLTRRADGTATLARKQFFHPPNQNSFSTPSQWNYTWHVPISLVVEGSDQSAWDSAPTDWVDIANLETTLTGLPTNLSQWVMFNAREMMFYRVFYDTTSRTTIINQLLRDHNAIIAESRSQFVDDTFSLARASYLPETEAMETTRFLSAEMTYNAWQSAIKHMTYAERLIRDQSWLQVFQTYYQGLTAPVYDKLGWFYGQNETPLEQFLRRDMISTSCTYGNSACLTTARQQFSVIKQNPNANSVHPNNLPTVLCTGVGEGQTSDWDMIHTQYQRRIDSQIRDERYAYLFGLTCTTDTTLLDRFLSEIVGGVQIAVRDQSRAMEYLAQTTYGSTIVWNYFYNNWRTMPSNISKFTILQLIAQTFKTTAQLTMLEDFIATNPPFTTSETNSYTQSVLTVQQNIVWFTDNADSLQTWLEAHQPLTARGVATPGSGASPLYHWQSLPDVIMTSSPY